GTDLLMNRQGRLNRQSLDEAGMPLFADFENRGVLDLMIGGAIRRCLTPGEFALKVSQNVPALATAVSADFDQDGRIDIAGVSADGIAHLLINRTLSKNGWLGVSLTGVKNLR